jgi:hypothetical protein
VAAAGILRQSSTQHGQTQQEVPAAATDGGKGHTANQQEQQPMTTQPQIAAREAGRHVPDTPAGDVRKPSSAPDTHPSGDTNGPPSDTSDRPERVAPLASRYKWPAVPSEMYQYVAGAVSGRTLTSSTPNHPAAASAAGGGGGGAAAAAVAAGGVGGGAAAAGGGGAGAAAVLPSTPGVTGPMTPARLIFPVWWFGPFWSGSGYGEGGQPSMFKQGAGCLRHGWAEHGPEVCCTRLFVPLFC